MIRYYATVHGGPFLSSERGPQYFAWDEDREVGSWVSAVNGQWLSRSGITPRMSVAARWRVVEPFHPAYLELDAGL